MGFFSNLLSRWHLSLRWTLARRIPIVLFRFSGRNGQGIPFGAPKGLRKIYDLSHVVTCVCKKSVSRLVRLQFLPADRYHTSQILIGEPPAGGEECSPSAVPSFQ